MNDPQSVQLLLTTCPDAGAAQALAKSLVSSRLAACVNIVSNMASIYHWQGKLCEEVECLLLIKTTSQCLDAIQALILSEHPYELPELIAVPIDNGLPAYLNWIKESVNAPCE